MPRDGGGGNGESRRQRAGGHFARGQHVENLPPRRVRQRGERAVEFTGFFD